MAAASRLCCLYGCGGRAILCSYILRDLHPLFFVTGPSGDRIGLLQGVLSYVVFCFICVDGFILTHASHICLRPICVTGIEGWMNLGQNEQAESA